MTAHPDTNRLLTRLRNLVIRYNDPSGSSGAQKLVETIVDLDDALTAGAPLPASWQRRPDDMVPMCAAYLSVGLATVGCVLPYGHDDRIPHVALAMNMDDVPHILASWTHDGERLS